jgi:hypothetical protein
VPEPPSLAERERTLELLNAELSQRLAMHSSVSGGIDTKATFFIGFAALGLQLLLSQNRAPPWDDFAFAFFIFAIAAGVFCVSLREYKVVPEPMEMETFYNSHITGAGATPNLREQVLAKLTAIKRVAIEDNKKRDKSKVRWWWALVVAFGLAVTFSLISLTEAPDGHGQRHTGSRSAGIAADR